MFQLRAAFWHTAINLPFTGRNPRLYEPLDETPTF